MGREIKFRGKRVRLRNAVERAQRDANKLSFSLQNIWRNLVFVGFPEDDEPLISIGGEEDIFIHYRGSEIDLPTFIDIMEERGYITKEDFIL